MTHDNSVGTPVVCMYVPRYVCMVRLDVREVTSCMCCNIMFVCMCVCDAIHGVVAVLALACLTVQCSAVQV